MAFLRKAKLKSMNSVEVVVLVLIPTRSTEHLFLGDVESGRGAMEYFDGITTIEIQIQRNRRH
jgi:hypothetical protein